MGYAATSTSGGHVDWTDPAFMAAPTQLLVAWWAKFSTPTGTEWGPGLIKTDFSTGGWWLFIDTSNDLYRVTTYGTGTEGSGLVGSALGTGWHHFGMWLDNSGATGKIWIDGTQNDAGTSSGHFGVGMLSHVTDTFKAYSGSPSLIVAEPCVWARTDGTLTLSVAHNIIQKLKDAAGAQKHAIDVTDLAVNWYAPLYNTTLERVASTTGTATTMVNANDHPWSESASFTLTATGAAIGFTGVTATLTWGATGTAAISMGARTTIVTSAAIAGGGYAAWPDSNFGVLNNGSGTYAFYASDGGRHGDADNGRPSRSVGTMDNPLAFSTNANIFITGKQNAPDANVADFAFQGGGPVYRDPLTGRLIIFTHNERAIVTDGTLFGQWYSWIGVITSTNGGNSWTDCGTIITPWHSFNDMVALYSFYNKSDGSVYVANVGEAPYLVVGPYFYVYYHNVDGEILQFGLNSIPGKNVARALVSDVLTAAASATQPSWQKYTGSGTWTQPGIRGQGVPVIGPTTPNDSLMGIGPNSFLNRYIVMMKQYTVQPISVMTYRDSTDGVNWSAAQQVTGSPTFDDSADFVSYFTLVDPDNPDTTDPLTTGQTFYLIAKSQTIGDIYRWPVTVTSAPANTFSLTATAAAIGFTGRSVTLTWSGTPPGIAESWPTPHTVTNPSTINGDQTWTVTVPGGYTYGVVSNAAVLTGDSTTTLPAWARCETALSTPNHEVSCRLGPIPDEGFGPEQLGPCARFDPAASTFYMFYRDYNAGELRIGKCVAGTLSVLLSGTGVTATTNDTLTLRATGTSPVLLTGYKNGAQIGSTSDASAPITGNLRGGIFLYLSRFLVQHGVHSWSAVDVALGTSYVITPTPAAIGFTGFPVNLTYTPGAGGPPYQPHTVELNRGSWRGTWRGSYAGSR